MMKLHFLWSSVFCEDVSRQCGSQDLAPKIFLLCHVAIKSCLCKLFYIKEFNENYLTSLILSPFDHILNISFLLLDTSDKYSMRKQLLSLNGAYFNSGTKNPNSLN